MAGPTGRAARPLQGKDLWLVASTGGPEESYHPQGYNRYFFDAFLPPYEQTAALCGMRFLPPLVLHGAHKRRAAEVQAHVAGLRPAPASYPDWPESRTCRTRPATCPPRTVPRPSRSRPPDGTRIPAG
jgi:glutathione-regulated potassium-efflux system ancillary protein KefF